MLHRLLQTYCLLIVYAMKLNGIARLELAHLPQLSLHKGDRTDEATQTGTIRTEYDRHVAGEIHRADGIGIVMNVGGMQAGFTPIATRPLRLGTNQAHTGTTGVVMHLPIAC